MKQLQIHDSEQAIRQLQHDPSSFSRLKEFCAAAWCAFGNVLLLIGGDDSAEIGFNLGTIQMLNQSSIPLATNDNKG